MNELKEQHYRASFLAMLSDPTASIDFADVRAHGEALNHAEDRADFHTLSATISALYDSTILASPRAIGEASPELGVSVILPPAVLGPRSRPSALAEAR